MDCAGCGRRCVLWVCAEPPFAAGASVVDLFAAVDLFYAAEGVDQAALRGGDAADRAALSGVVQPIFDGAGLSDCSLCHPGDRAQHRGWFCGAARPGVCGLFCGGGLSVGLFWFAAALAHRRSAGHLHDLCHLSLPGLVVLDLSGGRGGGGCVHRRAARFSCAAAARRLPGHRHTGFWRSDPGDGQQPGQADQPDQRAAGDHADPASAHSVVFHQPGGFGAAGAAGGAAGGSQRPLWFFLLLHGGRHSGVGYFSGAAAGQLQTGPGLDGDPRG